jgi:hypothetical protein
MPSARRPGRQLPQGAEAVAQFGDEQAGLLEGREVPPLGMVSYQ